MKVGDLVRYIYFDIDPRRPHWGGPARDSSIGLIIEDLEWPNINVMWDDGAMYVHDSHDLEVISEV